MRTLLNETYYTDWENKLLNKGKIKNDEQLTKDTKQTIISLAYGDYLSYTDLYELSDILSIIAQNKVPNKKKGL